jgi:hypothetical protein
MASIRWFAAPFALSLTASCLQPTQEADCLLDGRCECKARTDCADDRDCVNGLCVVLPDAGIGEQGWPCAVDSECLRGPCLPLGPGNGRVCSATCDADGGFACARGWECKSNSPGAPSLLCAPPIRALCLACKSDQDCNAVGDRCLPLDGGSFCGQDCSLNNACVSGFTCRSVMLDGSVARQCVPDVGTCACSAVTRGLRRSCKRPAPAGTCFGFETCQPTGSWSGCDAREARQEVCNGLDDDCNGLTDQPDPALVTTGLPGYPDCVKGTTCTGKWYCGPLGDGGAAFACSAPEPRLERCNGVDDDCNGVVDDGLRDAVGAYSTVHACGSCATDCFEVLQNLTSDAGVIPEGAASCEVRNGTRVCVPQRCAQGYYPSPAGAPQTCEKAVTSQCRPCTTISDCQVPGDQCVAVGSDPGFFCAQSCDPASVYANCTGALGKQDCCPTDNTCELVGSSKLCVPKGRSCQCTPARSGFARSCFVSTPSATCIGEQTCDATGSFGSCDTSRTTVEFCDGRDNDCDGVVDNGYIDTRSTGTYDTDAHCGQCNNDCRAKWSPTIQHATGGCRTGAARTPACAIVACTAQTVAGGGACGVDADCGAGRTCNQTYHQCVRPCVSGACTGGEVCRDGFCSRTCTSDAECQAAYGKPSTCNAGNLGARTCEVGYQFVNADLDETNGCECAAQGMGDEPDTSLRFPTPGQPAVDRNCDSVDGDAATAIFVWALSPSSQGSRTEPYRTLAEALRAFQKGVNSAILVAQGTYVEQVVLRDGVSLHGGYSSDFSRRDVVLFPTLIEASEPSGAVRGTVNAENLSAPTVLAGFTIRGYDVITRPMAGTSAKNSYALYVKNAAGLVIRNNHLVGGRGGDGAPALPGVSGANGAQGRNGLPTRECNSPECSGETQTGGQPGANPACPAVTGGNAGAGSDLSVDPQAYQGGALNGRGGANATYQHSDSSQNAFCKYDCTVPGNGLTGGAATNGGDGAAGLPGAACAAPLGGLAADDWATTPGSQGTSGTPGRGGGGGGAGGCVRNQNPPSCTIGRRVGDLGGTGGGGGAGGCGGARGTGAAGGGGSFAIFVVGAPPAIDGNLIDLGFGGVGGVGGAGGYGGLGGQGGRGGDNTAVAWCAGQGGPGGRGGNGGAGSGGGGGCGGSVFGIAGTGVGAAGYELRNTLAAAPMNAAGLAGAGGASPAGPSFKGGDGAPGVVLPVQSF